MRRHILLPIILLTVIGVATAAWISVAALWSHDNIRQQDDAAYESLATVERAQAAHAAIERYAYDILEFNEVTPQETIQRRFRALNQALSAEIGQLTAFEAAINSSGKAGMLRRTVDDWNDAAEIALGLVWDQAVPTRQHLEELGDQVDATLSNMHKLARTTATERGSYARALFFSQVVGAFSVMLLVSGAAGILFLLRGRRLADSLLTIARAMERIRGGEFSTDVNGVERKDEIGAIARGVSAFGMSLQDLTAAKGRIEHMALHDQLTGLPNRRALSEYLSQLFRRSRESNRQAAVLHIDLDRFKQVNDLLGHAAGDDVLRHAAQAMRAQIFSGDMVARIGGDEFVIVLSEIKTVEDSCAVARRVIEAVSKPITVSGQSVYVGASVGIACHLGAMDDPERLLMDADIALYSAKRSGRGKHCLFSDQTREAFERDMELLGELRIALDREEIIAFFQPQVDDASGEIIGMEALARWRHPQRGLLAPGAFLHLAFEYGLGDRLTELISADAVAGLAAWRARGLSVPSVSINLSSKQLRDGGMAERLDDLAVSAGLPTSDISVEIVENVLFNDEDDPALTTIRLLQERGCRIELDDFGTGYASISNLQRFKVDRVKIDRAFIAGIDSNEEQALITRAIIDLCDGLNIECLAEGVETDAERNMLIAMGCSRFQGYAIAAPMSRDDAASWLLRRKHTVERVAAAS